MRYSRSEAPIVRKPEVGRAVMRFLLPQSVMPALVAGIHVFLGCQKGVDGRVKPDHDD
jgi:hypothetical protein